LISVPRRAGRIAAVGVSCVSCLLLFLLPRLQAYEAPLSSASLQEAWTLGQRDDQATANLVSEYVKQVAEGPQTAPRIAEIEVLTPFLQVVDQSRQKLSGYTELQAVQDYHKRGDTVVIRVLLMLPAAYPRPKDSRSPVTPSHEETTDLRSENFWQTFRFNVKQHGRPLVPRSIQSKPVYSAATKDAPSVLDGTTVWLQYDAKDVASDEIVVEIITPGGKTIATTFLLNTLR
jgi:hypothetical protein